MTTDEMRLEKFEIKIKRACQMLSTIKVKGVDANKYWNCNFTGCNLEKRPLEYFISRNSKNAFTEIIFNSAFDRTCTVRGRINLHNTPTVNEIVEKMEKEEREHGYDNAIVTLKMSNKIFKMNILFWMLMILAIDTENYNENLNIVADTAYLFRFNGEEVSDLTDIVIAILTDKDFKNIEYKSREIKELFSCLKL